jgi:malate/lactate dehydrogenase
MYPDITHGLLGGENLTTKLDHQWVDTYFNPKVGKRGAEIIAARNLSSAASAGNSALEHIRDWVAGT